MPNYVGFLRGTEDAQAHLSPAEAQHTLERYLAWNDDLHKAGNTPSGGGLSAQGRVIRRTSRWPRGCAAGRAGSTAGSRGAARCR